MAKVQDKAFTECKQCIELEAKLQAVREFLKKIESFMSSKCRFHGNPCEWKHHTPECPGEGCDCLTRDFGCDYCSEAFICCGGCGGRHGCGKHKPDCMLMAILNER